MDLGAHLVNQDAMREMKENLFDRVAQRMLDALASNSEKKFNIERLKALRATHFEGTTNRADVKRWLSLVEKCLRVMECHEEKRVKLTIFLLQGSVEDWWILHVARVEVVDFVSWQELKRVF